MSTGSFPSGAGEERIRGKLGQTFGRRLRKTFFLDAAYLPRLGYYITVTENFHHCPCCKEKKLVGARPGSPWARAGSRYHKGGENVNDI